MRKLGKLALVLVPLLVIGACASEEDPSPDPNVLTVLVPGADSVQGYTIHEIAETQNHPDAQEPWYIYLDYGVDAVRLPGPTFEALDEEDLASLFVEQDVTVESYVWGDDWWEDGIRVTLNERVRFDMKIEDYEDETNPVAIVELSELDGVIETSFIMLGNGYDGVAHDIEITVYVDGVAGEVAGPYTIEMRGNPDQNPNP